MKSLSKRKQYVKTSLPHLLVCVFVVIYLVAGGYVFFYFERNQYPEIPDNGTLKNLSDRQQHQQWAYYSDCTKSYGSKDRISRKNLTPPMAIFLAFTIVTTIGYGEVVPHTPEGKIFCILYGIVGIPLTLLAIANLGRFLSTAVQSLYLKIKRRLISRKDLSGNVIDDEEMSDYQERSLPPVLLLFLYAIYLCLGALIVQSWNAKQKISFLDGVYFSFVSLTSIGFGDIVPPEKHLWPTLLYVGLGLTLSTMAVDILAEYLRKLHYFGKVMTNSAKATIWFGGKLVTVKELIHAVGKYLGAPEDAVEDLCINLDEIVANVILERKMTLTARYSLPTPSADTEEYQGAVKPVFLEAARYDQINFIDENDPTYRSRGTFTNRRMTGASGVSSANISNLAVDSVDKVNGF